MEHQLVEAVAEAGAAKHVHVEALGAVEAELASMSAELGSLKAGSSGDGVALAEAEGKVAALESK